MGIHKKGEHDNRKKAETLRETYARLKREFTAADLQKYTQIEPMIPAAKWLEEMEAMYKEEMEKKKKRKP
jgi:hypothetical protein